MRGLAQGGKHSDFWRHCCFCGFIIEKTLQTIRRHVPFVTPCELEGAVKVAREIARRREAD